MFFPVSYALITLTLYLICSIYCSAHGRGSVSSHPSFLPFVCTNYFLYSLVSHTTDNIAHSSSVALADLVTVGFFSPVSIHSLKPFDLLIMKKLHK